jgi:peroxiredoxin
MRLRTGLAVAIPAFAVLLVTAGCQSSESTQTAAPTGQATAPRTESAKGSQAAADFSFTDLQGKKVSLSDFKGKPVVLNFWASWCHFCAQEAPDLEALSKQYKDKDLVVLGVGTDDQDALRQKAEQLKLTYPVGSNPTAAQSYGVSGVPHTFMIDRKGNITASLVGARPKADLEEEIKKIL